MFTTIWKIMALKNICKLAKITKRKSADVDKMLLVKDNDGKILCKDGDQKQMKRVLQGCGKLGTG